MILFIVSVSKLSWTHSYLTALYSCYNRKMTHFLIVLPHLLLRRLPVVLLPQCWEFLGLKTCDCSNICPVHLQGLLWKYQDISTFQYSDIHNISVWPLFAIWGRQRQEKLSSSSRGTHTGSCSRGRHWSTFPEMSLQLLFTGKICLFPSAWYWWCQPKMVLYSASWTKVVPDVSHLLSLMMYVTTVHQGHTSAEHGSQTEVLILTG